MEPQTSTAHTAPARDTDAGTESKVESFPVIDSDRTFQLLLSKAKAGDHQAFEHLMEYCGPTLRKQARHWHSRRLQSKFGDSDMMQEAHLRALAGIKDFHGISEGEFKCWLLTILDNVARALARYYKAAKRDAARELPAQIDHRSIDSILDDVFSPEPTPLELVQRQDIEDYLKRFGDQLLERQRQVFSMFLWEGLTFVEIACRLGVPLQEVQTTYRQVIERVRRRMKDSG